MPGPPYTAYEQLIGLTQHDLYHAGQIALLKRDNRALQARVVELQTLNVGHAHADGHLMGLGIVLPRGLDEGEAAGVLHAWLRDADGWPRPLHLFDGKWFACRAEVDESERAPQTLRPRTWSGPAKEWATVTPFVVDRHPRGGDRWNALAEAVAAVDGAAGELVRNPNELLLLQALLVRLSAVVG